MGMAWAQRMPECPVGAGSFEEEKLQIHGLNSSSAWSSQLHILPYSIFLAIG